MKMVASTTANAEDVLPGVVSKSCVRHMFPLICANTNCDFSGDVLEHSVD